MAKNKELKNQIAGLAAQLGRAVSVDGKNNAQLCELVKNLRAELAQKNGTSPDVGQAPADETPDVGQAPADETPDVGQAPADETPDVGQAPARKKGCFYMAAGKAITSRRGILADGAEVRAEYLPGGEETLKRFVKSGHIIKG